MTTKKSHGLFTHTAWSSSTSLQRRVRHSVPWAQSWHKNRQRDTFESDNPHLDLDHHSSLLHISTTTNHQVSILRRPPRYQVRHNASSTNPILIMANFIKLIPALTVMVLLAAHETSANSSADKLYKGHTMMSWIACTNFHSEACAPPFGPCLRASECAEVACRPLLHGSCLTMPGYYLCSGIQCKPLMRQKLSMLGRLSNRLATSS